MSEKERMQAHKGEGGGTVEDFERVKTIDRMGQK